MKGTIAWLTLTFLVVGGFSAAFAENLKDKVKLEILSVGLHPGMEPGMYVCGAGHLHIKGTVQNLAEVPLGRITVAGKAFRAEGPLLGTATASTKRDTLVPGEKAEFNLEFLTVTGLYIPLAKKQEITVTEAPRK